VAGTDRTEVNRVTFTLRLMIGDGDNCGDSSGDTGDKTGAEPENKDHLKVPSAGACKNLPDFFWAIPTF
jgi:hypothetical protein